MRWLALAALGCTAPEPDPVAHDPSCVDGGIDIFAPVDVDLAVPADLGRILACRHSATVSAGRLSLSDTFVAHGWTAETGYEKYVVQYATQGPVGTPRRATAALYLPVGGTPPYPLVSVDHGTNGLGPGCGPTGQSWIADYMALPLVGHGYAVVAPDYVGMGVDEGVYTYGLGEAEAFAVVDGLTALRAFDDGDRYPNAWLGDDAFLFGHSQGGQAALFAHDQHPDGLLGTVAFAPGFGDMRGLNLLLGHPERPVDDVLLYYLLLLYAASTYAPDAPPLTDWLHADAVDTLPTLLRSGCWYDLVDSVPAAFPTQGDVFTPRFLDAARRCYLGPHPCPWFEPYASWLKDQVPGHVSSDVPVLLLQGDVDQVVPPYTATCIAERMGDTPLQACTVPGADHYTIVDDAADDVLAWMAGRRQGLTPACAPPLDLRCP